MNFIEDSIINALKKHKFWGTQNNFFTGVISVNEKKVLYQKVVVNETEDKVYIIPCVMWIRSFEYEKAIVLEKSEITSIDISNGTKYGYTDIFIITNTGKVISIQVPKNLRSYELERVTKFINQFQNQGAWNLEEKSFVHNEIFVLFFYLFSIVILLGGSLLFCYAVEDFAFMIYPIIFFVFIIVSMVSFFVTWQEKVYKEDEFNNKK